MNEQSPKRRRSEAFGGERAVPILIAAAFVAAILIQTLSHFTAPGVATVVAIGALLVVCARMLPPSREVEPSSAVAPATTSAPAADPTRAATLDAAIDCVVSVDGSGIVREWNAAARNTFGFSAEEAIGQKLPELLIPPSQRERYGRMIPAPLGRRTIPFWIARSRRWRCTRAVPSSRSSSRSA